MLGMILYAFVAGIVAVISDADALAFIISILLVIISSKELNFFYYRLIGLIFILGKLCFSIFLIFNILKKKNINLLVRVYQIMKAIIGFCIIILGISILIMNINDNNNFLYKMTLIFSLIYGFNSGGSHLLAIMPALPLHGNILLFINYQLSQIIIFSLCGFIFFKFKIFFFNLFLPLKGIIAFLLIILGFFLIYTSIQTLNEK